LPFHCWFDIDILEATWVAELFAPYSGVCARREASKPIQS
jgi:hypothetical protein